MRISSVIAVLFGAICGLSWALPAKAALPGQSCLANEIGTTALSDDKVNIVACLKTEPGSPVFIWKNYMPDNALDMDGVSDVCQEGSLALFSQGRFVCKNESACHEGDVVVYKKGRFLCEKQAQTYLQKNYVYSLMGMTELPAWMSDWYGKGYATAYFTGKGLYDATMSATNGIILHKMDYTAKSTGRAKIMATIPFRYTQKADVFLLMDGKNPKVNVWQEAVRAKMVVKDALNGDKVTEGTIADPHAGANISSGDVGRVVLNMPVIAGQTYPIEIRLTTSNYNSIANQNTQAYGFAGTMAYSDHWTDGYVEIWEMTAP